MEGGVVVDTQDLPAIAEFYEGSKKIGIGKFEPCIYVKLHAPGSRDSISYIATDEHRQEYASAWELFQAGLTLPDGTDLEQLPACKAAFVMELKALNITTVEALAALDEPPEEYLRDMWKQAVNYVKLLEMDDA